MKLTKVALVAAGYVAGARAGRERYAQIVETMARASRRLEAYSAAAHRARTVSSQAPVALTAVPDDRGRLAEGVLVEASILGRILGLRLLKLDMTVVLVPSRVIPLPSARRHRPAHPLPPVAGAGPPRRVAARRGLAEAVRSLEEGAELLAAARRDGARPGRGAGPQETRRAPT